MSEKFWVVFDPYSYYVVQSVVEPTGAVSEGFESYTDADNYAGELEDQREFNQQLRIAEDF